MRRACCGVVCAITGPCGRGVCVRSVFPDSCTLCPQAAASLFSHFCAQFSKGLPPPWSKQRDDTIRYDTIRYAAAHRPSKGESGRTGGFTAMLWCQCGLRCCGANAGCDIVVPKQLERGIPADSSMDTPCFCLFVCSRGKWKHMSFYLRRAAQIN